MTTQGFDTVAHPRNVRSGRFTETEHSAPETTLLTPVSDGALRRADLQAQLRSEYVSERWDAGLDVGADGEISDASARVFAAHTLQNLPDGASPDDFPHLVEFAAAPYTEASGAAPEKVDALHLEIHQIRTGHNRGYMSHAAGLRLDMLATFAMHAIPGQD